VTAIDPQMIIETILSREWESWSDGARWWQRRIALANELDERIATVPRSEWGREEVRFFTERLDTFQHRRYQPPVLEVVREKLGLLALLDEARAKIALAATSPPPPNAAALLRDGISLLLSVRDSPTRSFQQSQARIARALPVSANTSADAQCDALWRRCREEPSLLGELVALTRTEHKRLLDAVIDKMAKIAQKPDYCVPRSSAGTERDRLFPREDSWDEDWYVGPEARLSQSLPGGTPTGRKHRK
jgi:hypothetical protein